MGWIIYGCGYSIGSSMFGDCPILQVLLCDEHAKKAEVQELLQRVAGIVRDEQISELPSDDSVAG